MGDRDHPGPGVSHGVAATRYIYSPDLPSSSIIYINLQLTNINEHHWDKPLPRLVARACY